MVPASRSPKGAPVHLLLQAGKALLVATRLVLQAHIRSVSRVGLAPLLLELAAERGMAGWNPYLRLVPARPRSGGQAPLAGKTTAATEANERDRRVAS